MSRQLFVWRMTPGPRAGAPCEPSPGQREAAHRPRESGHPAQGPLDATGALADVLDELSHGRLRCGWGVVHPAVDGRYTPKLTTRTALLRKLKDIFRRFQS
jgi:hypothetical protein